MFLVTLWSSYLHILHHTGRNQGMPGNVFKPIHVPRAETQALGLRGPILVAAWPLVLPH